MRCCCTETWKFNIHMNAYALLSHIDFLLFLLYDEFFFFLLLQSIFKNCPEPAVILDRWRDTAIAECEATKINMPFRGCWIWIFVVKKFNWKCGESNERESGIHVANLHPSMPNWMLNVNISCESNQLHVRLKEKNIWYNLWAASCHSIRWTKFRSAKFTKLIKNHEKYMVKMWIICGDCVHSGCTRYQRTNAIPFSVTCI